MIGPSREISPEAFQTWKRRLPARVRTRTNLHWLDYAYSNGWLRQREAGIEEETVRQLVEGRPDGDGFAVVAAVIIWHRDGSVTTVWDAEEPHQRTSPLVIGPRNIQTRRHRYGPYL